MIPILHPALVYGSFPDSPPPVLGPGVMMPGQLGPMSTVLSQSLIQALVGFLGSLRRPPFIPSSSARTLTMSCTGTPSVMQQISGIPADLLHHRGRAGAGHGQGAGGA